MALPLIEELFFVVDVESGEPWLLFPEVGAEIDDEKDIVPIPPLPVPVTTLCVPKVCAAPKIEVVPDAEATLETVEAPGPAFAAYTVTTALCSPDVSVAPGVEQPTPAPIVPDAICV